MAQAIYNATTNTVRVHGDGSYQLVRDGTAKPPPDGYSYVDPASVPGGVNTFDVDADATARVAAALAAIREAANDIISGTAPRDVLFRAFVLTLLDHVNTMATNHNDLLTWLGTQAQLTNKGQLPGYADTTPSVAQMKAAIAGNITAGNGDQ